MDTAQVWWEWIRFYEIDLLFSFRELRMTNNLMLELEVKYELFIWAGNFYEWK